MNVLYLSNGGAPVAKYLFIVGTKMVTLLVCITKAFQRLGITKFPERLLGLNDGVNVNTGIHMGLRAKIKEADWLQLIHCFNNQLELALKDAFDNSTFKAVKKVLN